MANQTFHHFYQKPVTERLQILKDQKLITDEQYTALLNGETLPIALADQLSENVIGRYALPFGVASNFLINGEEYVVPMAIEEPSVIAAASNGARFMRANGGIQTTIHSRRMIGQLAFSNIHSDDAETLDEWMAAHKSDVLEFTNSMKPSLVKRGGGAVDIKTAYKGDFYILYFVVDTKEAMGANTINTMLEATGQYLTEHFQTLIDQTPEVLMAILSNLATESLVTAKVQIPFEALDKEPKQPRVAKRIAQASDFAQADPYRAATHNKGIMNGVDAVVLASGNDWRAIEAGAHTYAAYNGSYRGLATWTLDMENETLNGELTLPMPIGTVGGSVKVHPTAQTAHELLRQPNAETLMGIIAAVGLAQNFAALRALVGEGIQHGHMKLQLRTLLTKIGAKPEEIQPVSAQFDDVAHVSEDEAIRILNEWRQTH